MKQNTQTLDDNISIYDKLERGKGKPPGSTYTDEENEQDYQQ